MTREWKRINTDALKPNFYYDFKLRDQTIILGGMYRNGAFGDKYGILLKSKPEYFRDHKFAIVNLRNDK